MASETNVTDELRAAFPGIQEAGPILEAFGIIGAYLSKGDIGHELKQLESSMLDIAAKQNKPQNTAPSLDEGTGLFTRKALSPSQKVLTGAYTHLLSGALLKVENANGLNTQFTDYKPSYRSNGASTEVNLRSRSDGSKVPVFATFLSEENFNGALKNYILAKDVGVRPRHGEFTHRIQWFTVLTALRNKLGRDTSPQRLLEAISTSKAKYPNPARGDRSVWDYLFDRFEENAPKAESGHDFRCPEILNPYLIGEASFNYPLLGSFLTARHNKRLAQGLIDNQEKYLAEKSYKGNQRNDLGAIVLSFAGVIKPK